jgi:hypothetical protein
MERKARLADELVAYSRIWLRVGRRVRILHAPHLGRGFDGRYGIITSAGGETFPDYAFVCLTSDQSDEDHKPHMIGLESLEPLI